MIQKVSVDAITPTKKKRKKKKKEKEKQILKEEEQDRITTRPPAFQDSEDPTSQTTLSAQDETAQIAAPQAQDLPVDEDSQGDAGRWEDECCSLTKYCVIM